MVIKILQKEISKYLLGPIGDNVMEIMAQCRYI